MWACTAVKNAENKKQGNKKGRLIFTGIKQSLTANFILKDRVERTLSLIRNANWVIILCLVLLLGVRY